MAMTDEEYDARMAVWKETNELLEARGEAPAVWDDVRDFLEWNAEGLAEHIVALRRE